VSGEGLRARLDELAQRAISGRLAAGMTARIEREGDLVFENSWGFAVDAAGRREPMSNATKFDIASLTKIFTTTAILWLVSHGAAKIDTALCDIDSMRRLAAGHPLVEKAFESVTIRNLLTHSSGLHYWYPFYASPSDDFQTVLEKVLERFPRGGGTVYSDINYMLLGKLVDDAYGASLDIAMRDLVCGPLGLSDSGYKPSAGPFAATEFGNRIERKMVEELGLDFAGWRPEDLALEGEADDGNCHYYFGGTAGHAGVFSTARDLCALGRVYLDLSFREGFIAGELAEEAGRDHGGNRGLGFQLGGLYPRGGFGHTGFTGTWLYLNRESGLAMTLLANRLHVREPVVINDLRREFADIALDILDPP